jgi:hypothetical protein
MAKISFNENKPPPKIPRGAVTVDWIKKNARVNNFIAVNYFEL